MKLSFPRGVEFFDNTDFRTIVTRIFFFFDSSPINNAYATILCDLLNQKNKDYPTEEELKIAKLERYVLSVGCRNDVFGTKSAIYFDLIIPNIKTLQEDYIEKQIQLLEGLIYRPYLKNNYFDDFDINRIKNIINTYIDNSYKDLYSYQDIRLRQLLDDNNQLLTIDITQHPELLDNITKEKLYDFYSTNILNNYSFAMSMGDIDEDKMVNLLNKYIIHKPLKELDVEYYSYLKIRDEVLKINETGPFKDSSLTYIFKIKDCTKEDDLMLEVIHGLLSSQSSRLLGKKLRDEEELVYSTKVVPYNHFGMLGITAFINKNNKDIVGEKILEVVENLKNEELIKPLLNNLKERRKINLLSSLDSIYSIAENHFNRIFKIDDTLDEKYEKMLNITEKDVSSFIDRLVLDTIFFVEEESE